MAVSSGGYSASDFTKLTRPGSQRRGTRLGKEVSYEVTLVVTPHVKMREVGDRDYSRSSFGHVSIQL